MGESVHWKYLCTILKEFNYTSFTWLLTLDFSSYFNIPEIQTMVTAQT